MKTRNIRRTNSIFKIKPFYKVVQLRECTLFYRFTKGRHRIFAATHSTVHPCYLLTPHPIAEEWLLFSTFPEQQAYLKKDFAHLVLYNLKTATWQSVRLDMGTETNYRLFANETGNVIAQIYAENGDNTKLIQYPCANLIK